MLNGVTGSSPSIIAHRGASDDAPENSLEAFRLAWQQGADGIEADFHLTADGRIVCIHDESTKRTTGVSLKISESRLEQLKQLDAGSWKGSGWSETRIPTLDEVLASIPEHGCLFIEIKCGAEIIPPLEKLLLASDVSPDRIRLLSFSLPLITAIKKQLPGWRACWTSDYVYNPLNRNWQPSTGEILAVLQDSGADGLASADRACLDQDMVAALRKNGKEIHVWTVDQPLAAKRAKLIGVDSIITNRPGWLRKYFKELDNA